MTCQLPYTFLAALKSHRSFTMLSLDLNYGMFISVAVLLHLHRAESYVQAPDCQAYSEDIETAVTDAGQSLGLGGITLARLRSEANYFGLTDSIFPNIDSAEHSLEKENLTCASAFSPPF